MMKEQIEINVKKLGTEVVGLIFLAVAMTAYYFQTVVGTYNTTVFAFSYKYGFISRGFMGTVLSLLDKVLPFDFMTYRGTQVLAVTMQVLFVTFLIIFFYMVLKRVSKDIHNGTLALIVIFAFIAFPYFVTFVNMGRLDSVMAVLSIIGVMTLLKRKHEWMTVVVAFVGMCIHQGYILMYLNIIMIILFSYIIDYWKEKKERYKYITFFVLIALECVVLFLYFNYLSQGNGENIYGEIYNTAKSLSADGAVHKQLIEHEILGINPISDEWPTHIFNFREIIIFTILVIPYVIWLFIFFKKTVTKADGIYNKLKYIAISLGWITILPDFLLKIDYGRWVFGVIFYYLTAILFYMARRDQIICKSFAEMMEALKKHKIIAVLLILYPLVLTPLGDVWITEISKQLTTLFFGIPKGAFIF